ncbi:MAG: hypothetical protein R3C05_24485 [Pirellulaceae bacterium]
MDEQTQSVPVIVLHDPAACQGNSGEASVKTPIHAVIKEMRSHHFSTKKESRNKKRGKKQSRNKTGQGYRPERKETKTRRP